MKKERTIYQYLSTRCNVELRAAPQQGYNKKDVLTESVVASSNYAIVAYLTSYDWFTF